MSKNRSDFKLIVNSCRNQGLNFKVVQNCINLNKGICKNEHLTALAIIPNCQAIQCNSKNQHLEQVKSNVI